MWLFQFFMKKPAGAALNACICLYISSLYRQESKLTSYYQVVNYHLMTYETDGTIAEGDIEIVNFKQLSNHNAAKKVQSPGCQAESPMMLARL